MKKIIALTAVTSLLLITACNKSSDSSGGNATGKYTFREPKMVLVQGGTFSMGSDIDQDWDKWNKPVHNVTLSSFYISKYPVTFEEYDVFETETNHRRAFDEGWGRGNRPVINVDWHDAVAYCNWLSKKTGKNYRLLTEAEWEYAARGGNQSRGYAYSGSNFADDVAWYAGSSNWTPKTNPVGEKQPNELGLYDMSGNVWEWCSDVYHHYTSDSQTNPTAAAGHSYDSHRIYRGGSWNSHEEEYCRVSYRNTGYSETRTYSLGFRVARSL